MFNFLVYGYPAVYFAIFIMFEQESLSNMTGT